MAAVALHRLTIRTFRVHLALTPSKSSSIVDLEIALPFAFTFLLEVGLHHCVAEILFGRSATLTSTASYKSPSFSGWLSHVPSPTLLGSDIL